MQIFAKKGLPGLLLWGALLWTSPGLAAEPVHRDKPPPVASLELPVVSRPELADIVPTAVALTGRLATLEDQLRKGPNLASLAKRYDEITVRLKTYDAQLQALTRAEAYNYQRLVKLKTILKQEQNICEEIGRPVSKAIRDLEITHADWISEKNRWKAWRSALRNQAGLDQLKSAFEKADVTIHAALAEILDRLELMLSLQAAAGKIQVRIVTMVNLLNDQILVTKRGALLTAAPPMFSARYIAQFQSGGLWPAVRRGVQEVTWPDSRLMAQRGWILGLQGFLMLLVSITVFRNRQALGISDHWRFLATRYFSAGLFLSYMGTVAIYEYVGVSGIWKLINTLVAVLAFSRLAGSLASAAWQRYFVNGVVITVAGLRIMDVISLPMPLFRIYTVLATGAGLILFLFWARESVRLKQPAIYAWLLKLGVLPLSVIMVAEFIGKESIAKYLFIALARSIGTVLVFMLFFHLIHGALGWLFRNSPFLRRTATAESDDTEASIRRVTRFVDAAIGIGVLLPVILMIWDVYDNLESAVKGLLALGFNLGSQRISAGLILGAAGILYGSFLLSWIFQKLLTDEVLVKRRMEKGVRISMARLLHYLIVSVGFLTALATLGFEISKITLMLSALGVGIGFGLRGIVNNFVSGLILLFEGPVRVGDTIEIGGKWSEIKRIGLRATTVETVDQADLIIPNAQLVDNQVTNWTLSNRRVRLTIPVGVAYGSDVPLVLETLTACANEVPWVVKFPVPQVLFLTFGESSLDFELRVWIADADYRIKARSELHQKIDHRFREARIEIAFPQRDLHLRGMEKAVGLPTPAKTIDNGENA